MSSQSCTDGNTPDSDNNGEKPAKGSKGKAPVSHINGENPPNGTDGNTPVSENSGEKPAKGSKGKAPVSHINGENPSEVTSSPSTTDSPSTSSSSSNTVYSGSGPTIRTRVVRRSVIGMAPIKGVSDGRIKKAMLPEDKNTVKKRVANPKLRKILEGSRTNKPKDLSNKGGNVLEPN